MKIHDCIQGTQAWCDLRSGIPTSSEFDRIITPKGEPSKSQDKFLCELLAERLMGHPLLEVMSKWMQRGKELESDAVSSYEFVHDVETVPVGFVTDDRERMGASPDRLVGEMGLLEIKCPSEGEHVSYLLQEGAVYGKYKVQCQGQLYIAEREWTDLISHHPEMPKAEIRVERDEEFIEKMAEQLEVFCNRLDELYADCIKRGWVREIQRPERSLTDILKESLEALS